VDPRMRLPYTGETASPVLSQARGPYAPIVPTAGEPTTRAVYLVRVPLPVEVFAGFAGTFAHT
jgi:hypothetical protein